MKEQLQALWEVQRVDIDISDAEKQMAALDGALELKKKYTIAKKRFEAADDAHKKLQLALRENELNLKTIDEKRAAQEKRLYAGGITNPKELDAVQKEIATLKQKQSDLDETVLTMIDQVEESAKQLADAETLMNKFKDKARAQLKFEEEEKNRLATLIAELKKQRENALILVTDRALLSKYDALRKKNGHSGLAKIINGSCSGCHVSIITAQIRQVAADSDEMTLCENCGRILMSDK